MNFEFGEYWGDMDFATRDEYVGWIRGGAARDLSHNGAGDGMGPRPHGSETLDRNLRVLDIGVERSEDVFERISALKFAYKGRDWKVLENLKKPGYQWSAYIITNGSEVINRNNIDRTNKTVDFFNGWDSSYHDAQWNGLSAIVGYGATRAQAEVHRDEMIAKLIPAGDPSIKKFKLRRLVREGD